MDGVAAQQFVSQLIANQPRIYAYILTLVPNWADADDLMQETAQVMWARFEESEPIKDFASWGMRIAQNKVFNHYAKKQRQRILFDADLMDDLTVRTQAVCAQTDRRVEAVQRCLGKLKERDRRLIRTLYEQGMTIKQLAIQLERPVQGFYKTMARIHDALQQCVHRTLASRETL